MKSQDAQHSFLSGHGRERMLEPGEVSRMIARDVGQGDEARQSAWFAAWRALLPTAGVCPGGCCSTTPMPW